MQIYIAKEGQQLGPYTIEQINAEAAAGRIKATDLAWVQGWTAWQPVSTVPGFVTASPPNLPPEAPPPPPPVPGGNALAGLEHETLLRAFVGKNYEYYARKWAAADQKPNKNTWNWAAFFLSLWWTAYRKMYRYALVIIGIVAGETICEYLFGLPGAVSSGINIGIAVAYGLQGNRWYRLHAEQKLSQLAPTGIADEATRLRIARAGGTSSGAVVAFTIGLFVVLFAIGFVAAMAKMQGGGGTSSGQTASSPKDPTIATWKAYQKIDHDSLSAIPGGKLNDLATTEAVIKAFRNISFSYSQLDLAEVDQILIDHLHHRMKTTSRAADVLESRYTDIVDAMKARDSDIKLSRQVGGVLAGDENRQGGSNFAEWLYRLGTDDDFQKELEQITERHKSEIDAMSQELSQLEEEEKGVATELTRKYDVEFIIPSA